MSINMAGSIDFKIFKICSVHLIAIISCLISQSLTTAAIDETTSTSTTSISTVLASEHNITFEASPVFAREKNRDPKPNFLPWMHLKPYYSNAQLSEEQATEVPIHQFTDLAKMRTNQIAGIRHADRNIFKNANHPKRRGPRVFQRPGNENIDTFDGSVVSYPYHLDSLPNPVPNTIFRHRDGSFLSHGQAHKKARMNAKASRTPGFPPHCQDCFRSKSNLNPAYKPDVDSISGSEKFFSEIPAHLALSVIDRESQNSEDLNRNAIENNEEFSESAMNLAEVSYPAQDVSHMQSLAINKDKIANVFSIKGNSNHFYFLLPNGSAASTINELKGGMGPLGTQSLDPNCSERCLQMQKSTLDNEISYQNRENPSQKILSCGCKSHNVADSRNNLPGFGQQDHGQHPTNPLLKFPERQNVEKHNPPATIEDILPLLKLLQESQKLKDGSNSSDSTKKQTKTTSSTSQSEGFTEPYEESEEEESDDDKASNRVTSDEIRGKANNPHSEKKAMSFKDFLSGKLL